MSENRRIVHELTESHPNIDGLVLCASFFQAHRRVTPEGFELNFALFCLSRVLAGYGLLAAVPEFVDRDQGHVAIQMLLLGLVFNVIAVASDSIWGLAAATARNWFARSPQQLALVGGAGGLAMIGSASRSPQRDAGIRPGPARVRHGRSVRLGGLDHRLDRAGASLPSVRGERPPRRHRHFVPSDGLVGGIVAVLVPVATATGAALAGFPVAVGGVVSGVARVAHRHQTRRAACGGGSGVDNSECEGQCQRETGQCSYRCPHLDSSWLRARRCAPFPGFPSEPGNAAL
ncbi:hypothetical protein [Saccharopolyspora sp. ASAGF58]|uniref:hypothetical protein n=1 Tax=Saccharopolyspora sp. ASAGF58 TaxID=2719023 RepID=UPI001B306324|nr:hypothetical protein [Saccharopolyspora sp. ASAGF58]